MDRIKTVFVVILMLAGIITGNMKGAEAMIEVGKTVLFDYVLTVDGEEVDSSKERGPLTYVHGEGNIVSGLESQLVGLSVGDEKNIVVTPEEGYGPIHEEAFQEVPKAQLPADMDPQPGDMLTVQTQDGQSLPVVVSEVRDDVVIINFNHPLAGKELHFAVKIVEIK